MRHFIPLCLTAAALFSCASTSNLPKGDIIGETMEPQTIVPFATVDASPAEYFDRTVLVEATVTAVCQNMGCWMQVEDEGRTAMVRWETGCGGEYAFPKDSTGKRVVIQGSFYPKELTEADAAHMQAESGGDLEIEREGYEFNASSVLLVSDAR